MPTRRTRGEGVAAAAEGGDGMLGEPGQVGRDAEEFPVGGDGQVDVRRRDEQVPPALA